MSDHAVHSLGSMMTEYYFWLNYPVSLSFPEKYNIWGKRVIEINIKIILEISFLSTSIQYPVCQTFCHVFSLISHIP